METNLSSWSFFSYFINVYLNLSAFRYSRLALFLVVFPPDVPNAFPVRTGWYAAREHQSRRARGMLSVPENDPTGFVRVKRRDQRCLVQPGHLQRQHHATATTTATVAVASIAFSAVVSVSVTVSFSKFLLHV